jgi:hypothetical protein
MISKGRLSATVDADVLKAAERAAKTGAKNLSAWVNDALRLKLETERKLRGMADFIAEWEAEHGVITDEDMERTRRAMAARAIHVRGNPRLKRRKRR